MKQGWENKSLSEVCEVLDKLRKPITKRDRIEGEYPYYGATGILSYVHEYIFDEQLVLLGEDGAKWNSGDNSSFIVNGKYWVNNHAHVIRPNREILQDEWLVYFLNHSDLTPFITGMTVPKLNQKMMNSIPIPLPPLAEQKRIVSILDKAFTAIDKAKAYAEQNLKNAKELFESYLQGVFEKKGKEWQEKRLGDLYQFKNGINFNKNQKKQTGILTLDVLNMYNDGLIVDTQKLYRVDKTISDDHFLKKDDILIVRSSVKEEGVAWATYFNGSDEPITYCGFIIKGRPLAKIEARYVTYFLRSNNVRTELISKATKSTITNINQANLSNVIIPINTLNIQKEIIMKLDNLSEKVKDLESFYQLKIRNLDKLRESILQKAFNGELT